MRNIKSIAPSFPAKIAVLAILLTIGFFVNKQGKSTAKQANAGKPGAISIR